MSKTDLVQPLHLEKIRTLLAQSLKSKGIMLPQVEIISPRPNYSPTPASFAQQRLWFLEQMLPSSRYNMRSTLRLHGDLDERALQRAWHELVRRQEMLRTSFGIFHQEPVQLIAAEVKLRPIVIDLTDSGECDLEQRAMELAAQLSNEPFDLTIAPLFRVHLIKMAEDDHILVVAAHHSASDGWSMAIFVREMKALYEAFREDRSSPLLPLRIQYADFAYWQKQRLQGEMLDKLVRYWSDQLADAPILELPVDNLRRTTESFRGAHYSFRIPSLITQKLKELSRREATTLFTTVLTAFQLLLCRYSGQQDVIVGTLMADRGRPDTENIIGLFVNTVVVRTKINYEMQFVEMVRHVQQILSETRAHQELPFEKLVSELNIHRGANDMPLFRVMFSWLNTPREELQVRGLSWQPLGQEIAFTKFDITLLISEQNRELRATLEYNRDLYAESTMARMALHFQNLLASIRPDGEQCVLNLELLREDERQQLLVDWNRTEAPLPAPSIQDLFQLQVEKTPHAIALSFEGDQLSYDKLNLKANQLGHYLKQLGVGSETPVALCCERSSDLVVGMLGIIKAGGTCVPLDPSYPSERLALMLEDSGAPILLTKESLRARLPAVWIQVVALDTESGSIQAQCDKNPKTLSRAENLVYVIYTSGTTGKPKGVAVQQQSVIRLVMERRAFQIDSDDVLLLLSPVTFDASTLEIWGALLNGAHLVVFPAFTPSLQELGGFVNKAGITMLWLTAGLFHQMVDAELSSLRGVRQLLTGGDVVSPEHTRKASMELPGCTVINGYGPTENTTFTSCYRMEGTPDPLENVPIGTPIANTTVYVLDSQMQPVPIGVVGELYTGGLGLARGYFGDAALTAEKFVPNPFSSRAGERLYRTGDRVRWRPAGILEFVERRDQQVKVRGYRIELQEIEAVLNQHPGVSASIIQVETDSTGNKRLLAYLARHNEATLGSEGLRRYLETKLPSFMVPNEFLILEKLPLTANGKVDRKQLPKAGMEKREREDEAEGRHPVEEILCGLWEEVLQVERVGVEEDFFQLGGHSLLATQVISRIRKVLAVELPLRALFEQPTVKGLAERIEQERRRGEGIELRGIRRVENRTGLALSYAQQRLWFIDQLEPGEATYNVAFGLRLEGRLNKEALGWSVGEIVRRHEVLRTRFPQREGVAVQEIVEGMEIGIEEVELVGEEEEEREAEVRREAREEAEKAFDLARGPLVRVKLLRVGEQEHVLLVTVHHIISDGWSVGVMVREFASLYRARSEGRGSELAPLELQYGDYAVWQREWLQGEVLERELGYWRKQLEGVERLELGRRSRGSEEDKGGGSVGKELRWEVGEELSGKLKQYSRKEGVTLFMMLLAGFQALLARYSGQKDVAVGTPIAGRRWAETEGMIGFFVNTLVLRTEVMGEGSFSQLLERVRETTLEAYEHQDIPFEKLVEELQPERELGRTPLFQVMFAMQNAPRGELELPGLKVREMEVENRAVKFDLMLSGMEKGGRIVGGLSYREGLFEEGSMRRLLGHWENLLREVVQEGGEKRVGEIEILSAREREQVVEEWNRTEREYGEGSIAEWFEEQVEKNGGGVAVEYEEEQVSYAELNRRANQLAHYLRRELGVREETRVGICVERSVEMVVGLLGILKAGGAYVPLDPTYPEERLKYMAEDAGIGALLSQGRLQGKVEWPVERVVWLDRDWEKISGEREDNPRVRLAPENLAYVIYTSGSTGKPKGVAVTHANVSRLFTATEEWFEFNDQDVWALFHSYGFDFSVWEIWGALLNGGRLIVVPYWVSRSPESLYEFLLKKKITVLNQTPSAFRQLSYVEEQEISKGDLSLRVIIFGGESLEMATLRSWIERHGEVCPRLVNMYGITETTVHVTYQAVTAYMTSESASLIGTRIPDLRLYVLNDDMQPASLNMIGELYVGGRGVARGYLNHPGLTATRFVPNPFTDTPGERLYRTGDLVRWRSEKNLEFLGRKDQQVKIRGHRIELGEIEAALEKHRAIKNAAVGVQQDQPDGWRLVGYIVCNNEMANPSVEELRTHLRKHLPDHMIPALWMQLKQLPQTDHGKLDRKALPKPHPIMDEKQYVPPRNSVEEILCRIWSQVLRVDRVGATDNFFEVGGDSILSIQVVAQAKKAGLQFTVRQLFEHQTIARLVQEIGPPMRFQETIESAAFSLISSEDRLRLPEGIEDAYPLSKLQLGMLFHGRFNADLILYHNVNSYRLQMFLDTEVLKRAIKNLVQQHPILRTSLHLEGYREPLQFVHQTADIQIRITDLSHLSGADQQEEIRSSTQRELRESFNIEQPGLMRFHIHKLSEESFQFTMAEHHVILDGWSVASMLAELFRCYRSLAQGEEWNPGPLATTFREFIALERQALSSEDARCYWEEQLLDTTAPQFPWPGYVSSQGGRCTVHVRIANEVSDGARALAKRQGVSLKSVLLAAHLIVTQFLNGGEEDTVTGLVTNGRQETLDGDRVLGLFLNTLPLRVRLQGGRWLDLIRDTAAAERGLLNYRRYPLAALHALAGRARLFEVVFNFTHFHVFRGLEQLGLRVVDNKQFAETNFALVANFGVNEPSSSVRLSLHYDESLINPKWIQMIAGYYQKVLSAMSGAPHSRYDEVDLLSGIERQQLLSWTLSGMEYERRCVHELFEDQARSWPEAVALSCDGRELTYAELNKRANMLGHHLRRLGVTPEACVGICLERSLDAVVAMLAVLKTGAAYVAIEPLYPQDRIIHMLLESRASLVLTSTATTKCLGSYGGTLISLPEIWQQINNQSDKDLPLITDPENLAYVIFTSGSTGKPKAVGVSHSSLLNLVLWHRSVFRVTANDRTTQIASIAFDAAAWELWPYLTAGASVLLLGDDVKLEPTRLRNELVKEKITLSFVPTPLAEELLRLPWYEAGELRALLVGGDELHPCVQDSLPFNLVNNYGPTECTVVATSAQVNPGPQEHGMPAIGKPVANTRVYVLGSACQLLPSGATGELYIAGEGLARGYLNSPAQTAERFAPNPFAQCQGERLYRTGDLVRWREDGNLEFAGRRDQQVKIRGYRIELAEVETALTRCEGVKHAAAAVQMKVDGRKELVGYIVGHQEYILNIDEVRSSLKKQLPEYMVPGKFVVLSKLPLTSNGKLDRKQLPQPDSAGERTGMIPNSQIELDLMKIWQQILNVESVGIHDSFFDLGGNSLLAMRLVSAIEQKVNMKLPLRALFQYPSIADLATLIGNDEMIVSPSPLAETQRQGDNRALFFVHGADGSAFSFTVLSRHLGPDQPFFAFQDPTFEIDDVGELSIEEIALKYIKTMRQIQPTGPYLVGGWSMGGLIAFEMARQLKMQDVSVAMLALADTYAPGNYRRVGSDDQSILKTFLLDAGLAQEAVQTIITANNSLGMQIAEAHNLAVKSGMVPAGTDALVTKRLFNTYKKNARAAQAYKPPATDLSIILLRAAGKGFDAGFQYANPSDRCVSLDLNRKQDTSLGWRDYASNLTVEEIPGTHFSILRDPDVRVLAERLKAHLITICGKVGSAVEKWIA